MLTWSGVSPLRLCLRKNTLVATCGCGTLEKCILKRSRDGRMDARRRFAGVGAACVLVCFFSACGDSPLSLGPPAPPVSVSVSPAIAAVDGLYSAANGYRSQRPRLQRCHVDGILRCHTVRINYACHNTERGICNLHGTRHNALKGKYHSHGHGGRRPSEGDFGDSHPGWSHSRL